MLDELIQLLVASKNEAADDVLLQAVAMGTPTEQSVALGGLLRRRTVYGLGGVIEQFPTLPEPIQRRVLEQIGTLHHALRECSRSGDVERRQAALKLIAISRQGKLAYILSENLHDPEELVSKAAVESLVALARWITSESRRIQAESVRDPERDAAASRTVLENRPEIEAAVARASDVHRGRWDSDLLRAALLLCDHPASKTLAILHTPKHGGQSGMIHRLQQPPTSEHVDAFLIGASHGGVRSHFAAAISHIAEPPALDAMLRRTHWIKDHQLAACVHHVTRGQWWDDEPLVKEIDRHNAADLGRLAEWVAASGAVDVTQDQHLQKICESPGSDFSTRLSAFRAASRRKRGASVTLLKHMLNDRDERLARMAARELVRRRPADTENLLLQMMTTAPETVRRVISRAIGQSGFEQFWQRFERIDKSTRKQAGRAMLKLLPDALGRLARRLGSGPIEQRLKGMQIAQELGVADQLHEALGLLLHHPNSKVRSKAVNLLGETSGESIEPLLDKALSDSDPRVRANAIEVLESKHKQQYVPLLAARARSSANRERANAIKAMHKMRVATARSQLLAMLQDDRPEHKISAMWALKQIGFWQMLQEVGRLAKEDGNMRVRRYAVGVLRNVAEMARTETPAPKKAG